MTPSQRKRRRKETPLKSAGDCYTVCTYRQAITRACDQADQVAHREQPEVDGNERLVPRWVPLQLRHACATEVRRQFGLEGSQVVLGHTKANVTEIYAERDQQKAAAIMERIG